MFDSISDPDTVLLITGLLRAFGNFDKILALSKRKPEVGDENTNTSPPENPKRVDFLECDQLAPTYGVLKSDALKAMDAELKVAVAGTARALAKIKPEERTWAAIMSVLAQSPVLEPSNKSYIDRADSLLIDRTNWFKKGEQYEAVVKEVQAWFTKLIVDPDILKTRSSVDLGVVTNIVAHAGNRMNGLSMSKKERNEVKVLDIGILRYPDAENPFIKVYRIELFAWCESKVIMGRAHDRNGISGQFNARLFKPRSSVIAGMRDAVKKKAIDEAEALFD